ncbi:MAG TPA: hypothetical protein VE972_00845 [Conexibacter sp.]|nr:hypothetical protein [Conexibacter sp.]
MRTAAERRLRALLAAACLVAPLLAAAPAAADVQWHVTSVHGPQNMPPGGRGQYVIAPFNEGDADTDGSAYQLVDTLPPGVTATAAFGQDWSCDGVGTGTVTCTGTDGVPAPGADSELRGAAWPVQITVDVPDGSEGTTGENVAVISGGSPGATPGSTTDTTTFSSALPTGTTPTGFGFAPGSVMADAYDAAAPAGVPARQAGSHPFEARVDFRLGLGLREDPDDVTFGDLFYTEPAEHLRTFEARLPAGLIGDPQAIPSCPAIQLNVGGPSSKGSCPANTQVGTLDLSLQLGKLLGVTNGSTDVPIYSITPPKGAAAAFGFSLIGNPVVIVASVDPSDRYAVIARIEGVPELVLLRGAELTLWGVPADHAHDRLRMDPVSGAMGVAFDGAPIRPFLTLPSQCDAGGTIELRVDSWLHPNVFAGWIQATPGDPATAMTGCGDPRFRFQPSLDVQPDARTPSTPTGLDVDLTVPQKDDTVPSASLLYAASGDDRAIATPPLRDARVTLPAGMTISPSAAGGLLACSPLQIGLGSEAPPACPDASKIGTASVVTPLLADPLSGSVYLAAQNENPFGSLLAIYLVVTGPGVVVKLPGKVVADPVTGQLTATFDDDPQLPVSRLHLHLKGGARAPLVTPATCGVQTTTATLTPWNASLPAVQTSDSFTISGDGHGAPCGPRGFSPGFVAGTTNPVAGHDSPVVVRVSRGDRDEQLSRVDVTLPRGLLGRLARVDLCPAAAAAAGRCGAGARIGTAVVAAGPGPDPFFISDGRVYLTGRYRGAPFGLAIVVHAVAGPFDLGNVIVRAQVRVDRRTAVLRVVTDPLPTILDGIPLQVRIAQVTVDRPGFTFNPTNCRALRSRARITSTSGTLATPTSRFQVGDCGALPFHPRLTVTVGRRGHTAHGTSTPLTATVSMGRGQANLAGVAVDLPTTLSALLTVANDACTRAQYDAGDCAKARLGHAIARTPLLRAPLEGDAFFVQDPTKPAGALPNLIVALRGQVAFDLVGTIRILNGSGLGARFNAPDVPIRSFTLRLFDGPRATLAAATNLCSAHSRRARMHVVMRAQNGREVDRMQRLAVRGCGR